MEQHVADTAYFSVLRWLADPGRDEARNIAVVMTDLEGTMGALKAVPISAVSPLLAEQGIVDGVVEGLRAQFCDEPHANVLHLREMSKELTGPLSLTEPRSAAVVGDADLTLDSLYRAFVYRRQARPTGTTKGQLLDSVLRRVRRAGLTAERGKYFRNYLLDAVVEVDNHPLALGAYSFRQQRKTWGDIEKDAGYFVFATDDLHLPRVAVIEPPESSLSKPTAFEAHDRITGWLDRHGIEQIGIDALDNPEVLADVALST